MKLFRILLVIPMALAVHPPTLCSALSSPGSASSVSPAAALPAVSPLAVASAQARDDLKVGIVAAVKGSVEISSVGRVGKIVESGESVYLGDIVTTDETSSLQLMLMDETIFTIGPNSSMTINEYVFDPKTDSGKISAEVFDGVFRMISGRVPTKKPSSMKVKLPTGVMAVRGTMAYMTVKNGAATGILGGPGKQTNTGHRIGSIEMQGESKDGETPPSTLVSKPGFASTVSGDGESPTKAFQYPPEEFKSLQSSFGTKSGAKRASDSDDEGEDGEGDDDGEVSATEASGQGDVESEESLSDFESLSEFGEGFENELEDAAEDINASDAGAVLDGITRFQDLGTIETGVFHFSDSSVQLYNMSSPSGTYDFAFDIDFGARTVGGGNSGVSGSSPAIDSGDVFQFDIPLTFFDDLPTNDAIFSYSGIFDTAGSITSSSADIDITLFNEAGEAALYAEHEVAVSDMGSTTVDGSDITDDRSPGLST